jgi:diguanylate cyclase (GGDEF)-like protein/PAS domain S-box-containing protein
MQSSMDAKGNAGNIAHSLRILLIEDQDDEAELIQSYLGMSRGFFYKLTRATCLSQGLELIPSANPDIILSDLNLSDSRGYDTVQRITQEAPNIPIILLTNLVDESLPLQALREGAQDYLAKPELSSPLLLRSIRYAIERKNSEEALRVSQERYLLAVQGANDGIWDWDLRTNRIYYSSRWKAILGCADREIQDSPDEWFSRIHPDDIQQVRTALAAHYQGRKQHFECEYRIRHKENHYLWVLTRGLVVRDDSRQAIRMAGSHSDITPRKNVEEQLRFHALYDTLTGLPNRALFMDRLKQAIARKKRRPDYQFAVLFVDLDHFKVINGSLGHAMGDRLLVECARKLEGKLRTMDTVSRLGGDEFVILLDDISDVSYALNVAERLQQGFKTPIALDDQEVVISASIGIVPSTLDHDKPEDILRDADTAMYQAKMLGRSCHALFTANMRQRVLTRMQLETDLRMALANQEMLVHYQPIITLNDCKILGFEALIRWNHPEKGLIPPKEFIPIAEETGMIHSLGLWVLRQACEQMSLWHKQYPINPPMSIHVNISRRQFSHPNLVENIQHVLHETGLDPNHLKLEITESLFLEYDEGFNDILAQITKLGVKLQIDDFGTGYSSFNYLQRLPVSSIKIDSTFVAKMKSGNNHSEIVRSIITMAHNLGIDTIAEGVETEEQLEVLKEMNCNSGQGYFISKPITGELGRELLRKTKGTGQLKLKTHSHN